MLKSKKICLFVLIALSLMRGYAFASNTWMLNDEQNWDLIATEEQSKFFTDITAAQNLVNEGKTKSAKKEFAAIQKNFPDFNGKELNLFIKAELLLSQMKLTTAAKNYDKFLTKYQDNILRDKAVKRLYEIGITYLNGHKKVVLYIFAVKGNTEGINILEKMIDHAGYDSPIAIEASVAIAENYVKREKFNEAYLKWYEIYSLTKNDSEIKRDALLGMAKAKLALYNDKPESKKPSYDASCLRSARSYYQMLKTYYPDFAEKIAVDETLNVIAEQIAYKELSVALYYKKTGNLQSANLYFNMVIDNWPDSKSAEIAEKMLNENTGS